MTALAAIVYEPPCPRCGRSNGGHLLTCPAIGLPAGWGLMTLEERYG